jgi:hypothetical protein
VNRRSLSAMRARSGIGFSVECPTQASVKLDLIAQNLVAVRRFVGRLVDQGRQRHLREDVTNLVVANREIPLPARIGGILISQLCFLSGCRPVCCS